MTTKRMRTKTTTMMITAKRTTKAMTAMIPHKGDGKPHDDEGKPHTKGKFSKHYNPFFFKVVVEGQFVAGKLPVYSTTSTRPLP